MTAARQLLAIGQVSWRYWTRGLGPKPEVGVGAALKRLALMGMIGFGSSFLVAFTANVLAHLGHGRGRATTCFLGGWIASIWALVALMEAGQLRQRILPGFANPALLDPFPIFLPGRLLFPMLNLAMLLVSIVPSFLFLAPERFPYGLPAVTALALLFLTTATLTGKVLALSLRTALSPLWVRRVLDVLGACGMLIAVPLLYAWLLPGNLHGFKGWLAGLVSFLRPLARYLASDAGSSIAPSVAGLTLVGCAAYGAIWLLERRGYDRGIGAATGMQRRLRGPLNPDRVELLVLRRQGAMGLWILFAIAFGASCWLSLGLAGYPGVPSAARFVPKLPFGLIYFAYLMANPQTELQVARDRAARPLLASLPISPADTLGSKTRALRWLVFPLLLSLVPPLVATHFERELLWRGAMAIVALWFATGALVPVAFFRGGAGNGAGGAGRFLDSLVILIPLFAAISAPTLLTELPSLGALALVAWEARRAAALHVRWLDDAADDLDRQTPVWRALLVFAAFAGIEAFVQMLFFANPSATTLGLSYLVAGTVLIVLTLNGRDGLPALSWVGTRRWLLPAGLVAGGVAGLVAAVYGHLVERFELDPSPLSNAYENAGSGGRALLAVVSIALAPLAEELFFRGWLQPAIQVELPSRWKRYAFVLAAFAFAAIHPGAAFPAVFLLGLVAGFLYELSGGVLAGICAHAAYNAVVTFVHL